MAKISSKKLIKNAKNYINTKQLLPNVDLRKELTPANKAKITRAINKVVAAAQGYAHELVPMGRGRAKYLADNNLPAYMIGIPLSGGKKVNKKLHYTGGEIKYERGGAPRSRTELDTSGDENKLIASGKKILKNRKGRKAAITANGRVIGSAQGMRDNDTILKEAAFIFLKYADMSHENKTRTRKTKAGIEYQQKAAHPAQWGMGILFEKAGKKKAKNGKAKRK